MTDMHYNELPAPPTGINAANILVRFIDGFGWRYKLATQDLNKEQYDFRPIASSMSIAEVNVHIFHLIRMTCKSMDVQLDSNVNLEEFELVRVKILEMSHHLSEALSIMTDEELAQKTVYLKRLDKHFSFWYLINGFIEDAISHVGQINSWRRISGNPVPRISPFNGETF